MKYLFKKCVLYSKHLIHYYRHPGLTASTTENILRKLQRDVSSSIQNIDTEICYNLDCVCDFTDDEQKVDFNYSFSLTK